MTYDELDALAKELATGTTTSLCYLSVQQRLYVALAACDGKCLDVDAAACALRRIGRWGRQALEARHPSVVTLLENNGSCAERSGPWWRLNDWLITQRLWAMLNENPQWSFELIGSQAHREAKRPLVTIKILIKQLLRRPLHRAHETVTEQPSGEREGPSL